MQYDASYDMSRLIPKIIHSTYSCYSIQVQCRVVHLDNNGPRQYTIRAQIPTLVSAAESIDSRKFQISSSLCYSDQVQPLSVQPMMPSGSDEIGQSAIMIDRYSG